jgi:hypothetical protein
VTRAHLPSKRLGAGLLAALLFSACSGSDAVDPGAPPGIVITVQPAAVRLERGESQTLTVMLDRKGGFTGLVAFSVEDVPAGVTATSDTVPASAAVAVLHLDVGLDAAAGTTALTVRATATGIQAVTASLPLSVVGVAPPFAGTIFIDPDIITSADPTTFQSLSYAGRGDRTMYDRRVAGWITANAYLFDVTFDDGLGTEVQVNPEFGSPEAAEAEARKYAEVIGRLPTALRRYAETVWIHRGVEPFGGGNQNLLIHTGQAALYEAEGILEETFVHEAAHTSLDAVHASAPGWLAAQRQDGTFISTYAADYPNREDVAETFVPYLALRYRADRISPSLAATIAGAIPFRIAYLDGLPLDMYPIVPRAQGR